MERANCGNIINKSNGSRFTWIQKIAALYPDGHVLCLSCTAHWSSTLYALLGHVICTYCPT
eukprot:6473371-Amphidinium_carterae.1